MALSTTQYGYIIDPMVPFTDGKGNTIKDGFVRVFVAGSSTPVITYRNFDGAANQDLIELDNSGRTKTSVIGSKGITYKVCVYDQTHSQESPILTVDKVSVIGANITAGAGATVVTGLDGLTTKPDGFVDASVVGTDGYVALDHTLVTDDLNTDAKVTAVENDRYVPLLNDDVNDPDSKMTLGRLWRWVLGKIKSLPTTITAFRTGDVIPVDGPSGTAKMAKDDLLRVTAENALGSIHNLATTATEADLVSGNFLAIDVPGVGGATKKLPAEDVAKRSVQDGLVNEIDGRTKSVSTADDAINVPINISAGEIFELSVNSTHSGTDFGIYAFYGAGSSDYDALQDVVENTGAVKFVAAKNYRLIRFYRAGRGYSAEGVVHVFGLIENVEEKNSEFEQQIGDIDYEVNGFSNSVSTADDAINVPVTIKQGDTFELLVSASHSDGVFSVYAFYGAGSSDYDALQDVVENTGAVKFVAAKNYRLIRFYRAGRGYSAEGVVHVFGLIETAEEKNSEFEQQIRDIDYKVNGFSNSVSTADDAINVPVTIKQGDTFELLVSASHSDGVFSVYAFYGTGGSDYDHLSSVTENVASKRVAAKNYRLIRFYRAGRGYSAEGKVSVSGVSQDVEVLSEEIEGKTFSATSAADAVDVAVPIKAGETFELLVTTSHTGQFSVYAFYGTGGSDYDHLSGVFENKPAKYVASRDYVKIRFYKSGHGYSAKCDVTIFGLSQKVNKDMMPVNILVIGDSFTMGNHWVSDCLSKLPEGSSVTSLAVIGASVKDGSNDRTTYPYTSRPVYTNNNTNKNTFGCQVEKLKRLMAGVDLDAGEVQLYTDGSYPDIIIVEGGQNDSPDINMDNYAVQFVELKENVYYKETSASAVVQGNCWAKSDIETIDRTCFAGAYRYVCETLKKLFPSSILMITTISNLNYWTKDIVTRADKIASQQKWCAAACGSPVIDWQKCQISTLTTYPGGSGTSGDPYVLSGNGQNYSDSNDGMHPNTRGDRKLGWYMANEIKKNFYK